MGQFLGGSKDCFVLKISPNLLLAQQLNRPLLDSCLGFSRESVARFQGFKSSDGRISEK